MSEATTAASLLKKDRDYSSMTADTPTPYRIADLIKLIDERIGQLEGKTGSADHEGAAGSGCRRWLPTPAIASCSRPRRRLDTMRQTIGHIFRIPKNDRPICVFQLAGLPSEVVNSVASVLCRMAFDLAGV